MYIDTCIEIGNYWNVFLKDAACVNSLCRLERSLTWKPEVKIELLMIEEMQKLLPWMMQILSLSVTINKDVQDKEE